VDGSRFADGSQASALFIVLVSRLMLVVRIPWLGARGGGHRLS
jgi:hypothetical protein